MEFITWPPEITSALIYSGPGAESLMEASGAWQRLGVSQEEAARAYASALSSLIESWHGPSSVAMVQAVEPFIAWLHTSAQQCQQMTFSAQAAAAAFTSTHSAVVPPSAISANRTLLAKLLATNGLGRNLGAIAATEAQYQDMWANNSAALFRYQASSAQASTLPQFSAPPQIADPAGAAAQASAVPATTATSSTASVLASTSAAPTAASLFPSLSSISDDIVNNGWFQLANTWGNQFISSGFPLNLLGVWAQLATAQGVQSVSGEIGHGLSEGEAALGASSAGLANAIRAVGSASAPNAALGVGVTVGKLTMPPAVVGLLPASQSPVQLAAAASPLPSQGLGLPMMPMMVPPPTSAGSGWRKRKQQKLEDLEYGTVVKGTVMPRSPSAG